MRGRSITALVVLALALAACGQTTGKYKPSVTVGGSFSALPPKGVPGSDHDPVPSGQIASLGPVQVFSKRVSCVPYAREVSGIAIRGDAWRWWDAAADTYARGQMPAAGAVVVMKKSAKLNRGHVAMVTGIVNSREVIIDHANWRRGEVHKGARMLDVSANNDWSKVRVWYPPIGDYGTGVYALNGFIYPTAASH